MALVFTNQTSNVGTGAAAPASVAYANNTLYLLSVGTTGTNTRVTAVSGGGLTWAKVNETTSVTPECSLWCGFVTSGASTGTLTVTHANAPTRVRWSVDAVTGSKATAANNGTDAFVQSAVQNSTAAQTSSLVTLANFADATNNAGFCFVLISGNNAITKEASWTQLSAGNSTGIAHLAEYIIGQDTTATSTFASNTVSAVAGEIGIVTGTGAFAAAAASFSGTATETITGTGDLAAAAASFAGVGSVGSAPSTASTTTGGGAPYYDITPVSQLPPPVLITGAGNFAAAPASFAGVMDVGPDPRIAMWHREDEELLRMLP